MLDDGAEDLEQLLYLAGPGKNMRQWNNTGVYRDFACAAGKVHIPKNWKAAESNDVWTVYSQGNLQIAVHSRNHLGVVALFHQANAGQVLKLITDANPQPQKLYSQFNWPGSDTITYDLHSPKNLWVIKTAGKQNMNRQYDTWPLMDGDIR